MAEPLPESRIADRIADLISPTPAIMARQTRDRKPTNYALDPYKDLGSDDSDAPVVQLDSEEDEDFKVGPRLAAEINVPITADPGIDADEDDAEDYEDDDDEDDDVDDDEEDDILSELGSDIAGGDGVQLRRQRRSKKFRPPRTALIRGATLEAVPGEGARLHRPHKFRVNRVPSVAPGVRRRDRLAGIADVDHTPEQDLLPVGLRPPDPSVKITYRPGFIKSTGKRERIVTAYGANTQTLVMAVKVRDAFIGLPAVPERSCLGFTPFWNKDQDYHAEVGMGRQQTQRMEYYDTPATATDGVGVERYLPAEKGVIKCIIGPQTGKKIITFQRFGMHDLAGTGKEKRGFILNAGGQVVGIDWAPNRPKGWQYLAISTKSGARCAAPDTDTDPNTNTNTTEEPPPAPSAAFDSDPSPSCIQIWRFPCDDAGTPSGPPSLALALCHEWGPARGLRWCQIPKPPTNDKDLGLLGAVFRDGSVRVLHIILPDDDTDGDCVFVKLIEPAFECSLPDTICTTMAWLSDHEVVVGCANGAIAAWSLPQALDANLTFTPFLYAPIHQTYIASLATCYPSFPTHVVTASLDGYCRLTSLLDPFTDTVVNNRSRIAPTAIAWVDHVNAAVSCEEGAWVKFYPLRRFFSATTCCKHHGVVGCVAASLCHSFVMSGGSEGECSFSNPVRRTFHGKIKNYQQTWFQLEYAKKSGMFRMTDGFKLEEFETKSEKIKRRQNNTALVHSTAYPEESNITQVCWNPNTLCGAWATAGTACGLVRVEDVVIES